MHRQRLRPLVLVALVLVVFPHAPARAQELGRRTAQGGASTWKLAFELAFATDAPYAAKFPNLYERPYAVNRAVTKDVIDRVHRPRVESWIAQAFRRHAPVSRQPRHAARNRARVIFPTHSGAPQRISIRAMTAYGRWPR